MIDPTTKSIKQGDAPDDADFPFGLFCFATWRSTLWLDTMVRNTTE
jgi:hypothetical protein